MPPADEWHRRMALKASFPAPERETVAAAALETEDIVLTDGAGHAVRRRPFTHARLMADAVAAIKASMQLLTLPPLPAPAWAATLSDEEWRRAVAAVAAKPAPPRK